MVYSLLVFLLLLATNNLNGEPEWNPLLMRSYESIPRILKYDVGVDYTQIQNINGTFAIDKYEYPNTPNEIPRTNLSSEDAKKTCEISGKRLCKMTEWISACSTDESNIYLLGNEPRDPVLKAKINCNLTSGGLGPSGAYDKCRNKFNLYDLTGNVWEWVDWNGTDIYVMAGSSFHFKGSMSILCNYPVIILAPQLKYLNLEEVGFRCCRDIEK